MGRAAQGMWIFAAGQAFLVIVLIELAPVIAALSLVTLAGAVAVAIGVARVPEQPVPALAVYGFVGIALARIAVAGYSAVTAWEAYVTLQILAAIAFVLVAWGALRDPHPRTIGARMKLVAWTYAAATVIRTAWYGPWEIDVGLAVATIGLFVCASGLAARTDAPRATRASEAAR